MRLRQVALAAHDLTATSEPLCDVLGLEVAFRDPGVATFGLENAVMAVGDTFLEVVSPTQEGTAAGRWLARRGGDAGYMVILQCEDLAAARARAEAAGARVVWEVELPGAASVHFHPRDVGGAILSFDAMDPPESWRWAGPDWQQKVRTETAAKISGVGIAAPDPLKLAARWAELLGLPVTTAADGSAEISLEQDGRLRFVQGAAPEPCVEELEFAVNDRSRFEDRARKRGVVDADGTVRIAGTRLTPR